MESNSERSLKVSQLFAKAVASDSLATYGIIETCLN